MEKDVFKQNAMEMIYLTICAIKKEKPDQERIEKLDLTQLFTVCQDHILTACVAYALESADVHDNNFTQAKEKAIRKNIIFDAERAKILKRLEAEKIWHMPLKGAILKDWYPRLGMRQMSDNDILCDGSYREYIRDLMIDMGFKCQHFGIENDDAYYKPPVCNFEMHNELFHSAHIGKLHEYYENVKDRLIQDENSEYGYHFRNEDFYIYMTAHEYKHFSTSGTGVRSLVDNYVFLQRFSDSMDWNYLYAEFEKLGINEYEKQSRELALKLFSKQPLTDEEQKLLDYYILSGTYGKVENSVDNALQTKYQGSKMRYIFHRLFPSMDEIKLLYPFFYEHKWLIPALWIYRPFKVFFKNRKKLKTELNQISKN